MKSHLVTVRHPANDQEDLFYRKENARLDAQTAKNKDIK